MVDVSRVEKVLESIIDKPKRKRKTKKTTTANDEIKKEVQKLRTKKVVEKEQVPEKVVKQTKKVNVNPPMLKSELDTRLNYVNKRLYHCKDENMVKMYEAYKEKLIRKEIIIDC